jgi:hypothetical protein
MSKANFLGFKGSNNWAYIKMWAGNYGPIGLVTYKANKDSEWVDFMVPIMPHEVDTYNKKPLSFYENSKGYNRRRK